MERPNRASEINYQTPIYTVASICPVITDSDRQNKKRTKSAPCWRQVKCCKISDKSIVARMKQMRERNRKKMGAMPIKLQTLLSSITARINQVATVSAPWVTLISATCFRAAKCANSESLKAPNLIYCATSSWRTPI